VADARAYLWGGSRGAGVRASAGRQTLEGNGYNWNISEKVGITCVFFMRGFGKRRKEEGVGFLEKKIMTGGIYESCVDSCVFLNVGSCCDPAWEKNESPRKYGV
jgi:hypothetical protein